jgi:hypothetical protein
MKRFGSRLMTLFLIPCFAADPALAADRQISHNVAEQRSPAVFINQALTQRLSAARWLPDALDSFLSAFRILPLDSLSELLGPHEIPVVREREQNRFTWRDYRPKQSVWRQTKAFVEGIVLRILAKRERGDASASLDKPESDRNVIDVSLAQPAQISAEIGKIHPPQRVVLSNAKFFNLGDNALRVPLIVKSILLTWPMLKHLEVVTDFPEVLEDLDPRVVAVRREDLLEAGPVNLWIDCDYNLSQRAKESPKVIQALKSRLLIGGPKISFAERVRRGLSEMGFRVPSKSSGLFPPVEREPDAVFVNPHGITNQNSFEALFARCRV